VTKEYAPGIPSKVTMHPFPKVEKPRVFEFGVHRHLAEHPEKYKGLHARIATQPAPTHYAPRAPSFLGWHLEQDLEHVKLSAFRNELLELLETDDA
jgi:hypothetical protein